MYEYALLTSAKGEGEIMRYSPEKFSELASIIESDENHRKTKLLKELLDTFYWELPTRKFDEIARYANGQLGNARD
jgi:hypothetical protein